MALPMEQTCICAVVVSYNPSPERLCMNLSALAVQIDKIALVDNASCDQNGLFTLIRSRLPDFPVELIANTQNDGVAAAHNKGIAWAMASGFSRFILMDQDSMPCAGMVQCLASAYERLVAQGIRVSAVGPRYMEQASGANAPFKHLGAMGGKLNTCGHSTGAIAADYLIASGALITRDVFEDVGPMDERLFIDRVDTDWFLRARSKGYQAFGVPEALMHHALGDGAWRIWFGRWRYLPKHVPVRHYYIFRNSILLYRCRYIPIRWIVDDLMKLLVLLLISLVCLPQRLIRLTLIVRGIFDGLRGRYGRLEHVDE